MSKELISISELSAYLYCPRKLWLSKIRGIREPPSREMILGRIKHKALENFNILEKNFIKTLDSSKTEKELEEIYSNLIRQAAIQAFQLNKNVAETFDINLTTFLAEFLPSTEREVEIRVPPLLEALKKYRGAEIWWNLSPKYSSELSIISEKLGLKGRIDRVAFAEEILPFEIKTRVKQEVYLGDKIQLAAYALLLEDKTNKKVSKGIIELRNSKKEIELTDDLKKQVLELAEKVRNLQGEFPSSFSKCESCSLKEECSK